MAGTVMLRGYQDRKYVTENIGSYEHTKKEWAVKRQWAKEKNIKIKVTNHVIKNENEWNIIRVGILNQMYVLPHTQLTKYMQTYVLECLKPILHPTFLGRSPMHFSKAVVTSPVGGPPIREHPGDNGGHGTSGQKIFEISE